MTTPRPFRSREEVDAYLNADRIPCLERGRTYELLPTHLARAHGMASHQYREKWGLPAETPLAGLAYRAFHREKANRLVAEGIIGAPTDAAREAARKAGRGKRVAWERREQAERVRPVGMKRTYDDADTLPSGKNARRAREYLSAWRALKRGDPEPMRLWKEQYTPPSSPEAP